MITIRPYKNAVEASQKNKRVAVAKKDNEHYFIQWKLLTDDLTPRSYHSVVRDKIVITEIVLTKESAIALLHALYAQLNNDGEVSIG